MQQTILALELADGFPTWQRLPLIIGFVSFVYGYVFFIVDYFVFMGFCLVLPFTVLCAVAHNSLSFTVLCAVAHKNSNRPGALPAFRVDTRRCWTQRYHTVLTMLSTVLRSVVLFSYRFMCGSSHKKPFYTQLCNTTTVLCAVRSHTNKYASPLYVRWLTRTPTATLPNVVSVAAGATGRSCNAHSPFLCAVPHTNSHRYRFYVR